MIESFKEIDNENIRLIICGDGTLKEFIIDATNKDSRIDYRGKLTQKELEEVYMESDVLIIPSIWDEPFGRVVIEGNYYGMPVIASDRGGIPEIIKTLKGGIIYNSLNKEELKNAIIKLSNRGLYANFRENILKKMYNYDISQQVERITEIYMEVLK